MKPFNPQQEALDENRMIALQKIIFRYIQEDYKQFKWVEAVTYGNTRRLSTLESINSLDHELSVLITKVGDESKKDKPYVQCNVRTIERKTRSTLRSTEQNFPLSYNSTPKDLANLAKVIYKWIKQEFESIE